METDYSSSDDGTTDLTGSSSSEEEEISNVKKELLDGILSQTKTKLYSVSTKEHNTAQKKLSIEAKVNVQCDKLVSGVSRLAKEGNICNTANAVIQPPYNGVTSHAERKW